MHSLRTFWHVPLRMPSRGGAWRGDRGRGLGRYKTMPEWVQMYGRQLTAQQKDERQDNDDKKQPCVSLPEWFTLLPDLWTDRRRTARRLLACASELRHSMCSAWGTWCACVYLVMSVFVHVVVWHLCIPSYLYVQLKHSFQTMAISIQFQVSNRETFYGYKIHSQLGQCQSGRWWGWHPSCGLSGTPL